MHLQAPALLAVGREVRLLLTYQPHVLCFALVAIAFRLSCLFHVWIHAMFPPQVEESRKGEHGELAVSGVWQVDALCLRVL